VSYEHDLVERAAQVLVTDEPTIESLIRRRDRKRRNERIAAGAVGLAIGIAVVLLGSAYLRSEGDRQTGDWPTPSITSTQVVRPGEVLLSPYPPDSPTSVLAVDASTGTRRAVDGCPGSCGAMSQFDASADHGWVAYHLWSCEECRPVESESGLWVAGAGTQARLVVPGGQPPWSWGPTGAQLAYSDDDELVLLDPIAWERTRIATAAGTIHAIAWAPDGRSIAYSVEPRSTGTLDGGSSGVFVIRSGGEPQQVSDAMGISGIAWSPDGDALVLDGYHAGNELAVVAADGSFERVLVEGSSFEEPGAPVWSPDGRRIAFVRTPGEQDDLALEIWVVGADGRGEVRVGVGDMESWSGDGPVWSPDSQRIAWSLDFGSRWVVVDADGGDAPRPIDRLEAERWQQG
jgi:WD40-like Beta Propeller Repeat